MMMVPPKESLLSLVRASLAVGLAACFVTHVWGQVTKYLAQKTMTVEEFQTLPSLRLPALTFCSDRAYKTPGFHFSRAAFEENSYRWQEIFHSSAGGFLEANNFTVREVHSQFRGRCFTLTSRRRFSSREYATVSIRAPHHPDAPEAYVFVHEPGQEFYVVAENFPFDVETETVGEGSDCIVEKKIDIAKNIPSRQKICRDWSQRRFIRCAEDALRDSILRRNFSCSVVWWRRYFDPGTRECSPDSQADLEEVVRIGEWVDDASAFPLRFASNPEEFGCPAPCKEVTYKISCRAFNSSKAEKEDDDDEDKGGSVSPRPGSELWFFYLKTKVETEEEILIYDFSEIVAGVGGSLGLFLGFSCFQGVSSALDYTVRRLRKRHCVHEPPPAPPPPPPLGRINEDF